MLSPQIHLSTGTETAAPVGLCGPVHLPWTGDAQLCPLALKEALDSFGGPVKRLKLGQVH